MNKKQISILDEEMKYKKKVNKHGLARSKHKHLYETVLLTRSYKFTNYKNGETEEKPIVSVTKVCTICGRIGDNDFNPSYYDLIEVPLTPYYIGEKKLSQKALDLPKWYANDYFDKFAHKCEDNIEVVSSKRKCFSCGKEFCFDDTKIPSGTKYEIHCPYCPAKLWIIKEDK